MFTAEACAGEEGEVDSWLMEYEYRDDSQYAGTPSDSQACTMKPQCAWNVDHCVPKCKCISLPEEIRSNETKLKGYAPSYGSSCAAHDLSYDYCAGDSAPSWCRQEWCYVKKSCAMDDITQSFYFAPVELFYSYSTCGGKDAFSSSQCADNTDEASCEDVTQCDWFMPDFDNDADGINDCIIDDVVVDPLPEGCEPPKCDKKKNKR
jgi:hypothetical protein